MLGEGGAVVIHAVKVDACPCCGARELDWPRRRNDQLVEAFLRLSREKYGGCMDGWEQYLSLDVARCAPCGHIWHHMQPDQDALFLMYAQGRRLRGGAPSTQPTSRMLATMTGLFRLGRTGELLPTLLDYGSGAGRWSVAAQQAGFRVTAYEPSAGRQRDARGVEIIGSLGCLAGRKFDVINLEQVLEHVPDPASSLCGLREYCHDNTVLRISVPDVARLGAALWQGFPFDGRVMHMLSPFEHLHGFQRSSLFALLDRAGLQACSGFRLFRTCPRYVFERAAIWLGSPFGRTTVLAQFRTGTVEHPNRC